MPGPVLLAQIFAEMGSSDFSIISLCVSSKEYWLQYHRAPFVISLLLFVFNLHFDNAVHYIFV